MNPALRTGLTCLVAAFLVGLGPAAAYLDGTSSLHFRTTWLLPTLTFANAAGCALATLLRPGQLSKWPLLATPILGLELIDGFAGLRMPLAVYPGGLLGGRLVRRAAASHSG